MIKASEVRTNYKDRDYGDHGQCFVCGRKLHKEPSEGIHLHEGGVEIVTEKEAEEKGSSGDMGYYPVGPSCAEKVPDDHLIEWEW